MRRGDVLIDLPNLVSPYGIAAAFLTGLASSLHCAVACSGISSSLLLLGPHRTGRSALRQVMTLQAGRITAYVLLGALVGFVSEAFLVVTRLDGFNFALRLIAAASLIYTGLTVAGAAPRPAVPRLLSASLGRLGPLIVSDRPLVPYTLGISWGLMPCGMVYLALINAGLMGGAAHAGLYMAAFGAGTVPLLAVSTIGFVRMRAASAESLIAPRRIAGGAIAALALAGLTFGGPSISSIICS